MFAKCAIIVHYVLTEQTLFIYTWCIGVLPLVITACYDTLTRANSIAQQCCQV